MPMESERREFFRVSTTLPVRARIVDPAEQEQVEGEIRLRRTPDLSTIDPTLAGWLDEIEGKLDRVLETLVANEHDWITTGGLTPLQLSGGGICFPVRENVAEGTLLLVELTLGGVPRRRVRATARTLGEGSARAPEADGPQVAVQFETITPEDRDAVVAYTLEVQRRETLRRRAGRDADVA